MARTQLSLDGEWELFCDPDGSRDLHTLERGERFLVDVPAPWQASPVLRDYSGAVWYRRRFEFAPEQLGPEEAAFVCFGAVDYFARVWLNGQYLGEHEGGYLPFEFELRQTVRPGTNELLVRVTDPPNDEDCAPEFVFSEIPHGKQSWYGAISGIWQSVSVETRPTLHIQRVLITPNVAEKCARVSVELNRPAHGDLRLQLIDQTGQAQEHRFAYAGQELSLPIPAPILWDTHSPHLYTLRAEFGPDHCVEQFGMRSIATSPDGHLRLNGRILFLRGALDQSYYPEKIYTPFSDAELDAQFAKAKQMGLNCLRCHIKIDDPRYYAAADRAGVLIWSELPNWENLSEAAMRRARATMAGMVRRDWNHPSIVIWTIINEGWGLDLAVNAKHRAWLAEMFRELKQLDSARLVVGNSPCFTNFHVVTDIEDFHNYYAIPDHYRQWQKWVQGFAARAPWTFAHSYQDIQAWRAFTLDPWSPLPRTPAPEVQRQGNEPMVVSEFGNWGLPDIERLRECYGGQEPWWFETGGDWGGGVVYPHGVEQRFREYHLDRIFGSLAGLAAASQRAQYLALKYQIEQMRRYPTIVGYIITEFTDLHWEANGLLDFCRNPKSFFTLLGNINSADALIPADWERVVFFAGERFAIQLVFSHFSGVVLPDCRVEWNLNDGDVRGTFEHLQPVPADLTPVGTIQLQIPEVTASQRAQLNFRLRDSAGKLVTQNYHEIYILPRQAGRPQSDVTLNVPHPRLAEGLAKLGYQIAPAGAVTVVETLTDEIRLRVQEGGHVLWLADDAEAQQTYLGAVTIKARHGQVWQGDWASSLSWLRQDKLFANIPSDGVVDFAFADLTPEFVIDGLRPRDFAASVYAGLFVGWLHANVALVAERRIGAGRLLICTFRLARHLGTNPTAMLMVHDLIHHLAHNDAAAPAASNPARDRIPHSIPG